MFNLFYKKNNKRMINNESKKIKSKKILKNILNASLARSQIKKEKRKMVSKELKEIKK